MSQPKPKFSQYVAGYTLFFVVLPICIVFGFIGGRLISEKWLDWILNSRLATLPGNLYTYSETGVWPIQE